MSDETLTDRIFAILHRARLSPRRDVHASTSPETLVGNTLRCNIAISRGNAPGIGTIIVCASGGDSDDLARALGRAMLCRDELGADGAIICVPREADLPPHFIETCDDICIQIADEDGILNTLARIGALEPEVAAVHTLTRWLQRQRMNQWTDEVAAAWIDDLQPIAEFRARLLGS